MKRQNDYSNYDYLIQRVTKLEQADQFQKQTLSSNFMLGCLRTDGRLPTSSTDVTNADKVYDRVITDTYEYILVPVGGVLRWRRTALSSF